MAFIRVSEDGALAVSAGESETFPVVNGYAEVPDDLCEHFAHRFEQAGEEEARKAMRKTAKAEAEPRKTAKAEAETPEA